MSKKCSVSFFSGASSASCSGLSQSSLQKQYAMHLRKEQCELVWTHKTREDSCIDGRCYSVAAWKSGCFRHAPFVSLYGQNKCWRLDSMLEALSSLSHHWVYFCQDHKTEIDRNRLLMYAVFLGSMSAFCKNAEVDAMTVSSPGLRKNTYKYHEHKTCWDTVCMTCGNQMNHIGRWWKKLEDGWKIDGRWKRTAFNLIIRHLIAASSLAELPHWLEVFFVSRPSLSYAACWSLKWTLGTC